MEEVYNSTISNMGNTCYFSSALQTIFNCDDFRNYFYSEDYKQDVNESKYASFTNSVGKLIKAMFEEECIVRPMGLIKEISKHYPEYSLRRQQDAQEVLGRIIDLLSMGLNNNPGFRYVELEHKTEEERRLAKHSYDLISQTKEYSIINKLFYGQLYSEMICKNCNHRKYNFENFNLLNIPVTSKCKSLEDCIRLFEKPEIIDCDNSWTCENCNAKSNPIRLTKIYYLPKYLIICLKRFDNRLRKISNEIEFELDNFNYKQSKFKCVSICNHFGRILGGGHYTAYCRRDDKWIEFDDEGTEEIENPVTKNAYILIYEKKIN